MLVMVGDVEQQRRPKDRPTPVPARLARHQSRTREATVHPRYTIASYQFVTPASLITSLRGTGSEARTGSPDSDDCRSTLLWDGMDDERWTSMLHKDLASTSSVLVSQSRVVGKHARLAIKRRGPDGSNQPRRSLEHGEHRSCSEREQGQRC